MRGPDCGTLSLRRWSPGGRADRRRPARDGAGAREEPHREHPGVLVSRHRRPRARRLPDRPRRAGPLQGRGAQGHRHAGADGVAVGAPDARGARRPGDGRGRAAGLSLPARQDVGPRVRRLLLGSGPHGHAGRACEQAPVRAGLRSLRDRRVRAGDPRPGGRGRRAPVVRSARGQGARRRSTAATASSLPATGARPRPRRGPTWVAPPI